ncbi:MAG: Ig-like domain-containing protein [Myxococcaceae bacterium]|nr:Ig-like domain-containing protein [Myxococcaceae bacterium]
MTPANEATDVPVSSTVRVQFGEDMNVATFAAGFSLSDGANDVAGTVTAMGPRTLVFTPAAKLRPQHTFTARVTSAVTDGAGNALAGTRSPARRARFGSASTRVTTCAPPSCGAAGRRATAPTPSARVRPASAPLPIAPSR